MDIWTLFIVNKYPLIFKCRAAAAHGYSRFCAFLVGPGPTEGKVVRVMIHASVLRSSRPASVSGREVRSSVWW